MVEIPVERFFCKDSSSVGTGSDFSSEPFLVENVSSENVWIFRILLVEVEVEMSFERFIRSIFSCFFSPKICWQICFS